MPRSSLVSPLKLALFALAGAALLLGAPGGAAAAGKVSVQLVQILASDPGAGPKSLDPSLEELRSQLEKYSYRTFRNAGTEKRDLAEGEDGQFQLSGEPGFTLRVKASAAGAHIALDLLLKDPKGKEVLSTRLKVKDGGTGIVGKELESGKGHLFLAFTVKRG